MKVREVIPLIGPIPMVNRLKLFLEGIDFLADNVTSRVTCLFTTANHNASVNSSCAYPPREIVGHFPALSITGVGH